MSISKKKGSGIVNFFSLANTKYNFRDSLMIPLINCATSIFSGFAIFGVLGYMAELKGVPVDEVAASGW